MEHRKSDTTRAYLVDASSPDGSPGFASMGVVACVVQGSFPGMVARRGGVIQGNQTTIATRLGP